MSRETYAIGRWQRITKEAPKSAALKYALDVSGSRLRTAENALLPAMRRTQPYPNKDYTNASWALLKQQKRHGALKALQARGR